MGSDNIHWLVGDRFVCAFRKNAIIKEISKDGGWEVVEFTSETSDAFLSTINQSSVFGNEKYIFVHDISLPEQAKTVPFLEKIGDNKVLIVMEGDGQSTSRPDKRTSMYKKYGDRVKFFEPVIQVNGFPDKSLIPKAINILNIIIEDKHHKKINQSLLKELFERTKYDFGKTINEIDKSCIYLSKMPESIKEINNILSRDNKTVDEVVGMIIRKDCYGAIKVLNEIMNNEDNIDNSFMLFLYSLAENITFMLHCKSAIENGISSQQKIGEYVSDHFLKKDKKVDAFSSEKRYYIMKDLIDGYDTKLLVLINSKIEESICNFTIRSLPRKYVLNNLLTDIHKII